MCKMGGGKLIFSNLIIRDEEPIYIQIKKHIISAINDGELKKDSKLPSTREVATFLNISRNSVIYAYQELEAEGYIITKRGRGTFVIIDRKGQEFDYKINWADSLNDYSKTLRDKDIIKSELKYKKGMISFKSISPEDTLFNIDDFKKALWNAWSNEEKNLLNYGYAKGYKPLIEYFFKYMSEKGVDTSNKDILITNGFTEAFDIILSSLTKEDDVIFCEKPTHNTALKIMKAHGIDIVQVPMDKDGIIIEDLQKLLRYKKPKFGYFIPSYNNPTGIVTKSDRRKEIVKIFSENNIPIIEDGFNEELLYSSSPIEPIVSLSGGKSNGVIYIGSLSKILFPGLRIGWILADKELIDVLESVKRGRTIHSSFLDQSAFYYYLKSGAFKRYVKNVRKYYRDKYKLVTEMIEKYIPYEYVTGEGGLHAFIKLKDNIDARELLSRCYEDGVIFMPGDLFYSDKNESRDTFRIGFGSVSNQDIEKGMKIIGQNIQKIKEEKSE